MRRPRLAGPGPGAVRRRRILEGAPRDSLVRKTAELLNTAKLSKFEFEATCRHGLRLGFILAGHRWAIADLEAASIVSAALNTIGAVRPTWAMGQPEATIPRENCQRCGAPIAEEDYAKGRRYCSEPCARSAKLYREEHFAWTEKVSGHMAFYFAAVAATPERSCKVCGKAFRSINPDQTTCCRACGSAWRIDPSHDKTCPICSKGFHSTRHEQRYCSPACARAGLRASLPPRACEECGTEFHPGHPEARFCGERCRDRVSARRIRAAKKSA